MPSCSVEMVAPWIIGEYVYEKVHEGGIVIDNKGTNIRHSVWSESHPVLSEEAL